MFFFFATMIKEESVDYLGGMVICRLLINVTRVIHGDTAENRFKWIIMDA